MFYSDIVTSFNFTVYSSFQDLRLPFFQQLPKLIEIFFIHSYPGLKPLHVLDAHPSNCISLKFDPTGRYFAIGSADALVSIWDINELACTVTVSR